MKELTKAQKQTLSCVPRKSWRTAYEMGVSLTSLYALQRRDLIEGQHSLGSHVWPRSCIKWRKKK